MARGVGHFRSPEGRARFLAAYAEAMEELPPPTRTHDVPTGFGTVRAYEWTPVGGPDATPVVLLPGRSSGAPMWQANVAGFAARRTVFALDPLGDAGLSMASTPLRDMADQARWLDQALGGLDIPRAHVVGYSFGGATAAALAVRFPARVASLALLEPLLTFGRPPAWMRLWAVPASLPALPQRWHDRALAELGGVGPDEADPDAPLSRLTAAGKRYFEAELPTPAVLSDGALRRLGMPVLVAVAGERSLAGGTKAVRRVGLIPNGRARLWPGTTHSLPMQAASGLDAEISRFWGDR